MGRVEMRMYKRRQTRARAVKLVMILVLLGGMVIYLWPKISTSLIVENILSPSATAVSPSFDRTIETREVSLPEECWYAIQTGVFSTVEAAQEKAQAYTDRGAPGVVVQEGAKWRVFIACYGTEADAAAVRMRLGEKQRVDTYLYAWECPELRLRLTGMAGQLDVVEAGFTLLISTAAALRDTATALDAAQLTTAEVVAETGALDSQIALWEDTVRSRFGSDVPALVEGMLDVTENWKARYERVSATSDATGLSAALKAEAMGMYDEIGAWRSAVAEQ